MSAQGPSLEALRQLLAGGVPPGRGDEDSVRRQWWAALACLQEEFLLPLQPQRRPQLTRRPSRWPRCRRRSTLPLSSSSSTLIHL